MSTHILHLKDNIIYRAFDLHDALQNDLIMSVLRIRSGTHKLPLELLKPEIIICKRCGSKPKYVLHHIHKAMLNQNKSSTYNIFTIQKRKLVLMTIDHIIPKSLGGGNTRIKNLQWMCETCNTTKGAEITETDWKTIIDTGIDQMLANSDKRNIFLQDATLMKEYWIRWVKQKKQKPTLIWTFINYFFDECNVLNHT